MTFQISVSFGGSKSPPVSFLQIWLIWMLSIFPRKTSRICRYYIQAMMTLHLMKQIFFKFLFWKLLLFRSLQTLTVNGEHDNSRIEFCHFHNHAGTCKLVCHADSRMCFIVNSFGDYQRYLFSTCDGRQTSCRNESQFKHYFLFIS